MSDVFQKFVNPYRYGFNGKEKDDEVKGGGNSYDFGSRMFDPRIGRWMSPDPLTNQNHTWSTYAYAVDNPIVFVDNDGEWPGVTIFYFEFEVGAGLGYGLNYVKQGGVAYDEVGRTRFTASSALYIANQTDAKMKIAPEVVLGASISGTGNVKQNWEAETFQGMIGKPATGASLPNGAKGKAGYLLAVGASLNSDELQLGIGLGLGLKISIISTTIDESISLAEVEAEKADDLGTEWSLGAKTAMKNDKGEITGYKANVWSGDKDTGVEVYSSAVKDSKGNTTSSNVWASKQYTTEATAAEKADDED